ncbi:hypothetical protein [Bartonella sp. HY761]|uniref:hypothetical protein n=1 Tax=Bartonella sp. HY761 TaxID=2979330 RepID=UPI0021E314E3|nr:hypothetical protein [Bartonella sp. HY761]UXN07959.1 hypothetical protein N6A79_15240 [Bartonella sp. HY761]
MINRHFTQKDFEERISADYVFYYYNQNKELDHDDVNKVFLIYLEKIKDKINPEFHPFIEYSKEFYFGSHVGDEKFLEEKRIELWKKIGNYSQSRFYNEGRLVLHVLYSLKACIALNTDEPEYMISLFFAEALDLDGDNWQYIEPSIAQYYAPTFIVED